jgi:hypothetical protein
VSGSSVRIPGDAAEALGAAVGSSVGVTLLPEPARRTKGAVGTTAAKRQASRASGRGKARGKGRGASAAAKASGRSKAVSRRASRVDR